MVRKDRIERHARRLFRRWQRAVRVAESGAESAEVCRRYKLKRKDVQRARRILAGVDGASELWARAKRAAPRRLSAVIETAVLDLSCREPQWGRKRLARAMADRGLSVCPMTVRRVLRRNGRLSQQKEDCI